MFRFTIRDVLWFAVVIGMGVGWWVDHHRLNEFWRGARYAANLDSEENAKLRDMIRQLGGKPPEPLSDEELKSRLDALK